MNWKIVLPVGIVVLLLVAFFYMRGSQKSSPLIPSSSPTTQNQTQNDSVPTQVTTQNTDQTLDQSDKSVASNIDALDKDLQSLDQNDSSQDNLNNL